MPLIQGTSKELKSRPPVPEVVLPPVPDIRPAQQPVGIQAPSPYLFPMQIPMTPIGLSPIGLAGRPTTGAFNPYANQVMRAGRYVSPPPVHASTGLSALTGGGNVAWYQGQYEPYVEPPPQGPENRFLQTLGAGLTPLTTGGNVLPYMAGPNERFRPQPQQQPTVVPYGGPPVPSTKRQKNVITEFGGKASGQYADAQYDIDRLRSMALDMPSGTREYQRLRAAELVSSGRKPPRITPYVRHALPDLFTDEWLEANNYSPSASGWTLLPEEDISTTYWDEDGGGAGGRYGGYAVGGGPKGATFTGLIHWRV